MLRFFLFLSLIIPNVGFAETSQQPESSQTLQQLESLSPEPLYFTVPISQYQISTSGSTSCQKGQDCSVSLRITLADFGAPSNTDKDKITVITDRPIRQTSKVDVDEFIQYTTSAEKTGLVFTFNVSYDNKVVPVNFTVENATFNNATNALDVQSQMNIGDQTILDFLNENKVLSGDGAVLNVEG